MKLKLLALVAAAMTMVTGSAMAMGTGDDVVKDFGTVIGTDGTFFASGTQSHHSGWFADHYLFSVTSPSVGGGTVANQPLTFLGQVIQDIDNLRADLYTAGGNLVVNLGGGDYFSNSGSLAAGDYDLTISGKAVGSGHDSGTYSYSAFVSAVPEPRSYAMLLAGLGLIGTVVRRRTRS